ncbi:riboflavin synthase [Paenalkalicoccus suaedae]|uniref:Riboflavin synthase n=1 Tax=Paenalkalicoccus suaedae TaxID=2592382 RepID=A0A859FFP7_9BACI|nr:riboflavin synthase [Paenalkalicoccus suaedae]QKS71035.1 riboflavin synthase [Paenalkalicoccus suaedae]
MFTGIIEEKGKVTDMRQSGQAIVMTIQASTVLSDVNLGDSISVNGVCLTVSSFTEKTFTADLMPETVKATSLRDVAVNSEVNLERAMAAGGRFGGHFVSGHVDGVGKIRSRKAEYNAVYYEIEVSPKLRELMTMKGSVAVDGISLTIFGLTDDSFTISIIPHTLQETVLGSKGVNDIVNIENDMLAKYVEELLRGRLAKQEVPGSTMTESFLEGHGFK